MTALDWIQRTSLAALGLLALATGSHAQDTLVPDGATWRYLDDGSNQGTAWRALGFDDSTWSAGPAELGYGDGDEATVVSFGPNASNKYITTYFRHDFAVPTPGIYQSLELRTVRDDGAVVYINGTEVFRSNMTSGAIGHTTTAQSAQSSTSEEIFQFAVIDSTTLVAGTNTIAVEIHQSSPSSSDKSFDLRLIGHQGDTVTRGPYLQRGTPDEVTIHWLTDVPTESRVWIGPDPGSLAVWTTDTALVTTHVVRVTGLAADTEYAYGVGHGTQVLSGGDADHVFRTAPTAGADEPMRIWVVGDSGTANSNARAVRDAYEAFTGATGTSFMLMLGDNAYNTGSGSEYHEAVFETYEAMLKKTVVWPTRGNHEDFLGVYTGAFTLPSAAEAGGLASGTESYYSFDWGNAHFVCLDSEGSNRAVGGAMYNWAQADIQASTQDWIIAYWHHPPYTKGSHDSDTETRLIQMRNNFLPMLEANGVDLVMCGHSHSYERSFLIDGHYGLSGSFNGSMLVDGGDGKPSSSGAYNKLDGPNAGAVYITAGSSGKISGGPLNHPAMYASLNQLGSIVIDIDGGRMDLSFLRSNGAVSDSFRLLKPSYTGTYCTSRFTGAGCLSLIGMTGTASASSGLPFDVTATAVPTGRNGLLFYGFRPKNVLFGGGKLCIGGVKQRTPVQDSGGSATCDGSYTYDFNARIQSGVDPNLTAGTTVYSQYYFRDPGGAGNINLTDGAQFVIQP